ncbi:methicillin resistance factor FemB [Lactococcus hodotermopsidis]|uniref:Aminoacyltransferase FemA n=1 Tax=Pseudolactococcus hodotermopsidis TaxID=2709157 RepID=A0A6A0BF66_9LACT|nr:peptidoglycan bridge formation glycyltransferase FemA/FemB family protein [Lactococcus hodotermopsidis]GFH42911.1 methicillin resistance factor FemB [Lactococcus hodotermopsidis]
MMENNKHSNAFFSVKGHPFLTRTPKFSKGTGLENQQFLELSSAEFSAFVAKRDAIHFQQTKAFGDLQQSLGRVPLYFAVKNGADILAAILITLVKVRFGYLAEVHGNPYFSQAFSDNEELITGLTAVLKKRGVLKLVIHSNKKVAQYADDWEKTVACNQDLSDFYTQLGFAEGQLNAFEKDFRYNYGKNLSEFETFDQLQQSFSENALRNIKKAQKFGIVIEELGYDELAEFKKVIDEAGERRNFATRDLAYYQSAFKAYGEQVKFVTAKLNFVNYSATIEKESETLLKAMAKLQSQPENDKNLNKLKQFQAQFASLAKRKKEAVALAQEYGDKDVILAAAQFFIMPNEVLYMFSGMYSQFAQFSAPFLIQANMMRYAFEHKIDFYNFLGVNAPDKSDQGVLKFKQNFKGFIWQSSGNYELPINPLLNKMTEFFKTLVG